MATYGNVMEVMVVGFTVIYNRVTPSTPLI